MNAHPIPPRNSSQFSTQSTSFKLYVRLSQNQSKLSLTLQDYVDWIIYSREYVFDDIGKQIHNNVDLRFIYDTLNSAQTKNFKSHVKQANQRIFQENITQDYKFGTVVKVEGIPYYKIQVGGMITVYRSLLDLTNNKTITLESHLTLDKIKNMTDTQILTQKLKMQKMESQKAKMKEVEQQNAHRRNSIRLNKVYILLLLLLFGGIYVFAYLSAQVYYFKLFAKEQIERIQQNHYNLGNLSKQHSLKIAQLNEELSTLKSQMNKLQKQQGFYGKSNDWVVYAQKSSLITINFEHLNLSNIPQIFTSLHGISSIWTTTGATSIYNATNKQFQVFINGLTPDQMKELKVYLHYQIIPQEL